MFVCPSIFDTVSIGTPLANVIVVAKPGTAGEIYRMEEKAADY